MDNFGIYSNFIPPDPPPVEPDPRLPVAGDLVFGLNSGSATSTLKLVSGNAVVNGGVGGPGPWSSNNFIQSVEFDNNGGVLHNAKGNLLGVNFLSSGTGQIYSFATNGSIPAPAGQLIGNTGATGPVGQDGSLTATSLSGLSVSPNNSKIAVVGAGATAGNVIVYDYTAGDTLGAGAELANGRQTAPLSNALNPGSTQGTTWLDNDTVLAFSALGNLVEVTDNGTTLTESVVTTISTPNVGSDLTSLAYNPEVSPYVFAMYSGFASPDSTSRLYILDPANSYNLVNEVELSTSIGSGTPREIALDADGNLFIGGFGGVVNVIPDAAGTAATLADNSSVLWYTSPTFSSFNGLDIGFGSAVSGLPGDYNNDGVVSNADYNLWKSQFGTAGTLQNETATPGIVDAADYTAWRDHQTSALPGGGSLSAVPEPTSLVLLMLGLTSLAVGRRASQR